jgi:hypothetical protein
MSFVARPFAPAFARQAQAAVLMNTTDMTAPSPPGTTTFEDILTGVRGGGDPPL